MRVADIGADDAEETLDRARPIHLEDVEEIGERNLAGCRLPLDGPIDERGARER